jgi:hypothetical protein
LADLKPLVERVDAYVANRLGGGAEAETIAVDTQGDKIRIEIPFTA